MRLDLNIEIVGQCNLKCPSCPNQHKFPPEARPAKGFLSDGDLRAMLDRVAGQAEIGYVALYNWGEPTLHPDLAALLRTVREYGYRAILSSNLNTKADLDAIMAAQPAVFNVSASGFSQAVYAVAHRGGDIELVKARMRELSALNARHGGATRLVALYHLYAYNIPEALDMNRFAEGLGFQFHPYWAGWGALEETLPFIAGDAAPDEGVRFGMSRLPFTVEDYANLRNYPEKRRCTEQTSKLIIDLNGDVMLCCNTYTRENAVGNVLSDSVDELLARKAAHGLCAKCMGCGFTGYGHEFTPRALRNFRAGMAALGELFPGHDAGESPALTVSASTGEASLTIPCFLGIPEDFRIGLNFEGSQTVHYLGFSERAANGGTIHAGQLHALAQLLRDTPGEAHVVVLGPAGAGQAVFRQRLHVGRADRERLAMLAG